MKKGALLVPFLVLVFIVTTTKSVNAASQTINILNNGGITSSTDNPRFNSEPDTTATFNAVGVNNGTTLGNQTSPDSIINKIYTWRLNNLLESVCSKAELTSIKINASVAAQTEGNPDLAGVSLFRIDGSDQYNLGNYTISQGVDTAPLTGFATPPNNEGVYMVVRGTHPQLGGAIAGPIEATWDVSAFDVNDQFGIMIQQDAEDGTVNMQTTLSAVELTYDDTNCTVILPVTPTNNGSAIPTLASTGESRRSILIASSLAIILGGSVLLGKKRRNYNVN